jgi:hypothetical protein
MNIEFIADCPADLDADRFAALTRNLHTVSASVGAAIFGGPAESQIGAICFCGVNERFRSMSLLRNMPIPCAVVQDPVRPWFTGSAVCPNLPELVANLQVHMPHVRRWLVFGQSSGGYAALHASRLLPLSLAIAFSPQTFDDRVMRGRSATLPPSARTSSRSRFPTSRNSFRTARCRTPPSSSRRSMKRKTPVEDFVWLDHMHWARMAHIPSVRVFLLDTRNHSLLYRRGAFFASVLADLVRQGNFGIDTASGWLADKLYRSA